jgi:transmembrane sensor
MAFDENNMPLYSGKIPGLINKSMQGDLTEEELKELQQWTDASERNKQLYEKLTSSIFIRNELNRMRSYDAEAGTKKLMRRIAEPATVVNMTRRIVAAAVIALTLLSGVLFYIMRTSETKEVITIKPFERIKPGGNHALLTLADGSVVVLDSAATGLFARQGNTGILKHKDGQIIYQPGEQLPAIITINSVMTPKGGQYEVILPDGSMVKLNAHSRLDFPTAFSGQTRHVTLWGEAYFEVAKNSAKPFHVSVRGLDVQVTGTQFNINAYGDEAVVKNTLFEGGISVTRDDFRTQLLPGQELQYDTASKKFTLLKDADVEAAAAWRNGLFDLDNADVPALLRQIERWYDIEVVYASGVPAGKFLGQIPRSIQFTELLQVLNEGGLKTKMQGRKLIVL